MKKSLYDWCIENNNEELLATWDYEKNINITPKDISYGTSKKVWWLCENGHSYDAKLNSRTTGSGCPYCKHQKIKTGYNDLLTVYPEVAKFWNYQKNTLTPDKVLAGGHKMVWWKCEKGHEWESTIVTKINDHHCPYCSGRLVITGETDLETLFPVIAQEWDYEKNKGQKPSSVSASSNNKVWWVCKKCGHEWKALISNRTRDNGNKSSGCPKCSSESHISFPEKAVYFYLKQNLDHVLENINKKYFNWLGKMSIDIYIPELNLGVEYDGAWHREKTDLKKNRLCKENGITLIRIRDRRLPELKDTSIDIIVENRNEVDLESAIRLIFGYINKKYGHKIKANVDIQRDRISIYEVMNLQVKENSLLQLNPQLASEWNYEKNGGLQPSVVTANSHKKVWWICKIGHEWEAKVSSRNNGGNGCPICANKTPQINHDALEKEHPEILKFWHDAKNAPLQPKDITIGSSKIVWWKCPDCKYEWRKTILSQLKAGGCPSCLKKKRLRDKVTNFLLIDGEIDDKYDSLVKEWDYSKNEDTTLKQNNLNMYKKFWWHCSKCSYEWQTTISKRAIRGQGCPNCSTSKKHTIEEMHKFAAQRGGKCLSKEYINNKTKLNWQCSKGHMWEAIFNNVVRGTWCPICRIK